MIPKLLWISRKCFMMPKESVEIYGKDGNTASRWWFLLRIERTSEQNRRASKNGKIFSKQVSVGSLNQDLIGIALSKFEIEDKCYDLTHKVSISSRWVIKNENGWKIRVYCRQILCVPTIIHRTMLSKVSSQKETATTIQSVGYRSAIYLHTGRKYH